MSASALTLALLRDRVEQSLQDTGNVRWAEADVDEAVRQAIHRYSKVVPNEAIGTLTLAAAGREVDASSLSDLLEVRRVWWDYDSTDPAYPPNWRDFELWPGPTIFVKSDSEPASGDKVRVWYTKPHTLNGLDTETTTTFSAADETLLVIGAAAFAALARSIGQAETVTVDSKVAKKMREWGNDRLQEFQAGLAKIQARKAALASGIAAGPSLDRWDDLDDGWW